MGVASVLESILIIGFMIGIGVLLTKFVNFNKETRNLLIILIVNIAMPCIILSSILHFQIDERIFKDIIVIFFLSVGVNILGIASGCLLSKGIKVSSQKAREISILSGLGNTGFIGVPLCAVLFGAKGAFFAAVFDAGVVFTLWTFGVIILQKPVYFSFGGLKSLINPPLVAIVIGLIIAYFNLQLPDIFVLLTDKLANLASPLAMFYIGMLVSDLWKKRSHIPLQNIGIPIITKLLLLPIITILILKYLKLDEDLSYVVLLASTMPTLTSASIVFAKYKADEEMGASVTVYSTVFSLFTIPVIVFFLGMLLYH
ncbi:AEC family transporter [Ammoniphilus sp. 3BR4]|uniref:AEC family transporter n=1 Tax=Ammoniphilus sp. 3BR4 TaxID=3158265 RepID=UPI003467AD21